MSDDMATFYGYELSAVVSTLSLSNMYSSKYVRIDIDIDIEIEIDILRYLYHDLFCNR